MALRIAKEHIFAVVAIGIAILVGLALSEMALRLFTPSPTGAMTDPVLGIVGEAGGDHDDRGFRNDMTLDRADIVILGDSQTYGNNARREDSWPAVLKRLTGESIYQIAYGGFSPAQYEALLDDALALNPKHLFIALYTGNDLLETTERVYANDQWASYRNSEFVSSEAMEQSKDVRLAIDSGTDPSSLGHMLYETRRWLRAHSRLYALLGNATRSMRVALRLVESDEERSARINSFIESRGDIGYIFPDPSITTTLSPSYRFNTVDLSQSDTEEGWRLTQVIMTDIKSRVPENVRLTLVIIPTKELAYLELLHDGGEPAPPGFEAYESAERHLWSELESFCIRENFECIFTLDAITAALSEGQAAYGDDINGHPKAPGYAAIAEAVAEAAF